MLIGELAEKAGVSKDTIRHYDELNLLLVGERQVGSRIYREFSEDNITRIQMIRGAKSMGFTLAEVQKMTNDYDSGKLSDQQVFEILSDQLALIRGKISELQGVEQQLLNKLEVLQPQGIKAFT